MHNLRNNSASCACYLPYGGGYLTYRMIYLPYNQIYLPYTNFYLPYSKIYLHFLASSLCSNYTPTR